MIQLPQSGRHFLQIPRPTNVPDRILRAIERPTIDHRGPEFNGLGLEVLEVIKEISQTKQPVIIYPSSGTGAWEAALVNTLSPGDRVLMYDTWHFASTDNTFDAEFDYIDDSPVEGEQAYWVRVVQTDFHRAWSSPIYIENKIRKNL